MTHRIFGENLLDLVKFSDGRNPQGIVQRADVERFHDGYVLGPSLGPHRTNPQGLDERIARRSYADRDLRIREAALHAEISLVAADGSIRAAIPRPTARLDLNLSGRTRDRP